MQQTAWLMRNLQRCLSPFEDKATREMEPAVKAAFLSEATRLGTDARLAEVMFHHLGGWWKAKRPLTCTRRLYEDYGIAEADLEDLVVGTWQDYHASEITRKMADSYPNCKTVHDLMVFIGNGKDEAGQ